MSVATSGVASPVPLLKKGDLVEYTDDESGLRTQARVLSRAGKRGGKYENWWTFGTGESGDSTSLDIEF